MIGSVTTRSDIPAGSVIYYDSEKNALVVFNDETEIVQILVMPFVVAGLGPDPRIALP